MCFGKFSIPIGPYNVRDFSPENVGSPGVAVFVFVFVFALANLVYLFALIMSKTLILKMWKTWAPVYDPGTFTVICKEFIQNKKK